MASKKFQSNLEELGIDMTAASTDQVFEEIGQNVEAFAGMTWQTVGKIGQLLKTESGK